MVLKGDARSLASTASGGRIVAGSGMSDGKDVVVGLGSWSDTVTRSLGYRFLVGVKRGYHMHYGARDNARLNSWIMDSERGYFLAPMNQGIRLTTGAEFARRDAPRRPFSSNAPRRLPARYSPTGGGSGREDVGQ